LAAPAVNSERVFVCIVAGTTGGAEPAWVLTRGAKTTADGTVTWMETTGDSAVNGDAANTVNWTAAKAIGVPTLGATIQRNNGASYWICTTAGTMGASEPAWPNDTAGTTQADGTTTWTCLGVVGNFTGGQAPHARVQNSCANTWFAVGNTIYVGDNHAESQATAITLSPTGSNPNINKIICHNHSGSYPPSSSDLRTGASLSVTTANSITWSQAGMTYVHGLQFKAGTGVNSASAASILITLTSNGSMYFDACSFRLENIGNSGSVVQCATSNTTSTVFNNCTVFFGHVNDFVSAGACQFVWQNTGQILESGSAVPAQFFITGGSSTACPTVTLEALDLSQLTGVIWSNSGNVMGRPFTIKDCKLNASATITQPSAVDTVVQLVRSDSGATGYKSTRYAYEGTETTETSITRVGGATDPTSQAQSRKIVTTANSQWLRPFKAEPYAIWNPTTGANVTVTVFGTINAGALPNNDDIWMEVEYLGSSSFPIGTIVTTTKANLFAANAAVASDGSTWNVPAFTAWNPADLVNMTLSNNNLTATNTTAPSGVRAIDGHASGKYYWESTVSTWVQSATQVGFGLASAALAITVVGTAFVSKGTGNIVVNNVNSGSSLGALSAGNTIGIALDVTNNLCWFRVAPSGNWNGSGTANPATGVGGVSISTITGTQFPMFLANGAGEVATANFGASAFSGAVPSGFTSGWTATWSPFKLVAVLSAPQPGIAGYIYARVRAAKPSTTWYTDPQIALN
jgi:hypothetical protein